MKVGLAPDGINRTRRLSVHSAEEDICFQGKRGNRCRQGPKGSHTHRRGMFDTFMKRSRYRPVGSYVCSIRSDVMKSPTGRHVRCLRRRTHALIQNSRRACRSRRTYGSPLHSSVQQTSQNNIGYKEIIGNLRVPRICDPGRRYFDPGSFSAGMIQGRFIGHPLLDHEDILMDGNDYPLLRIDTIREPLNQRLRLKTVVWL